MVKKASFDSRAGSDKQRLDFSPLERKESFKLSAEAVVIVDPFSMGALLA